MFWYNKYHHNYNNFIIFFTKHFSTEHFIFTSNSLIKCKWILKIKNDFINKIYIFTTKSMPHIINRLVTGRIYINNIFNSYNLSFFLPRGFYYFFYSQLSLYCFSYFLHLQVFWVWYTHQISCYFKFNWLSNISILNLLHSLDLYCLGFSIFLKRKLSWVCLSIKYKPNPFHFKTFFTL